MEINELQHRIRQTIIMAMQGGKIGVGGIIAVLEAEKLELFVATRPPSGPRIIKAGPGDLP